MPSEGFNGLALCAGGGALELGLHLGSVAAGEMGCRCPVIDNAHGQGIAGRFVISFDCPLHCPPSAERGTQNGEPE